MKIYKYGERCNISGKKIRELREKRQLTQEQLAAKLQVEGIPLQQKSISRIEDGSRVVADYELKIFAKVLQVSIDFLLEEDKVK
ncbi:MAG: helix-turn-helix domain-containing protein [Acutalibacter sp.]|nr:helix-turn-helix domain-containing protein [Acutalibacter sp.]